MIIAGTGRRPNNLGGYNIPNPTYNKVCKEIKRVLLEQKPDKVISGFALGFDQWLANMAIKLNIPVIAAIPFKGQESQWNEESQRIYNILLNKCSEQVIVSEGNFSAYKMHKRNEWMVDHCDILITAWDNVKSGGTYECIKYAESLNKTIIHLDIAT